MLVAVSCFCAAFSSRPTNCSSTVMICLRVATRARRVRISTRTQWPPKELAASSAAMVASSTLMAILVTSMVILSTFATPRIACGLP
jgi:hypothetical protein